MPLILCRARDPTLRQFIDATFPSYRKNADVYLQITTAVTMRGSQWRYPETPPRSRPQTRTYLICTIDGVRSPDAPVRIVDPRQSIILSVPAGFVVVENGVFMGKQSLRININPADIGILPDYLQRRL